MAYADELVPAPAPPTPVAAQPSASPPPPPPPERQSTSYLGIGPAYAASVGSSVARSTHSYGVVIEAGKNIPLADRVDLGLRFAWGLTAWDRFEKWAKAGYDAGAWTTEAYSDVYDWTRKHSGDPNTHGLRIMGSFFAFMTLWIGYVVAGIAYAVAVVAPTTSLEFDLTGNYNFGDDKFNPYVKGGLGLLAFIHPDYGTLRGGIGPTFGVGFRASGVQVGANLTWSPPLLHGEPREGRTHIYVGGLTIGVGN